MIVNVALPTPLYKSFDYLATKEQQQYLSVGLRVIVPFGRRKLCGIIMSLGKKSLIPSNKLKPILSVVDQSPLINSKLFELGCWLSQYYHHPIGETFATMLPKLIRQGNMIDSKKIISYQLADTITKPSNAPKQLALINYLELHGTSSHQQLIEQGFNSTLLKTLLDKKIIIKMEADHLTTHADRQHLMLEKYQCANR